MEGDERRRKPDEVAGVCVRVAEAEYGAQVLVPLNAAWSTHEAARRSTTAAGTRILLIASCSWKCDCVLLAGALPQKLIDVSNNGGG